MNKLQLIASLCIVTSSLAGCGGTNSGSVPSTASRDVLFNSRPDSSSPIAHVILIVQENRTFNALFATFPGATGSTVGKECTGSAGHRKVKNVSLTEVDLYTKSDPSHSYTGFLTAWDGGKMDCFNQVLFGKKPEGAMPYQYVKPAQVKPYWALAQTWGLANAMFTTQGSASFTAHQDLIRGGSMIDSTQSLIDNPPYSSTRKDVWGCDSPKGTTTSLITTRLVLKPNAGPFPCTNVFPHSGSKYETLRDLMDAKSVSWKYYAPEVGTSGGVWSAFDAIAPVRYGSEWGTNVTWPPTNIFTDIDDGALPSVSWVIPDGANSDHPNKGSDTGPSWVASVVNAIGESSYWNTSAIIVVWDDWGGFYDPVAPPTPRDKEGGPGLRVPMIVISPYVRETSSSQPGYISNTVYEFGSIIQFIEDTFNLGRLGTTDGSTNSMSDMFDFNQNPRPYQTVGSKYSKTYFLHQKPSMTPVDTY